MYALTGDGAAWPNTTYAFKVYRTGDISREEWVDFEIDPIDGLNCPADYNFSIGCSGYTGILKFKPTDIYNYQVINLTGITHRQAGTLSITLRNPRLAPGLMPGPAGVPQISDGTAPLPLPLNSFSIANPATLTIEQAPTDAFDSGTYFIPTAAQTTFNVIAVKLFGTVTPAAGDQVYVTVQSNSCGVASMAYTVDMSSFRSGSTTVMAPPIPVNHTINSCAFGISLSGTGNFQTPQNATVTIQ
jgi:hypothetical protein